MTRKEKKMKAAAIAVSCFLQQESECKENNKNFGWGEMGKNMIMNGREFTQRRGKIPGNSK
ncbi:MAG: hypothetical protein U9R32_00735 [Bacteroidota bacterium]|nr:hypothetical protein [Bacteroidota bacterium]